MNAQQDLIGEIALVTGAAAAIHIDIGKAPDVQRLFDEAIARFRLRY